jgi:hypothetical protein
MLNLFQHPFIFRRLRVKPAMTEPNLIEKFKFFKTDIMTNLCTQPFLLSLEQAAEQTGNLPDCENLLQEQQSDFMKYVQSCFCSGVSAPKRFQFMKTADYKLDRIHLKYADHLNENNPDFYRFWSLLIVDTRKFVTIGIDTLEFQAKCPAFMLAEPEQAHTFPPCKWTAQRSDLMEAITGIYQADVIRLIDGSRPSFALFVKEIGNIFGITFVNPHEEMRKVLNRKKGQTPFFHRIISVLKGKIDETDM